MALYRCQSCRAEQQADLPPVKCGKCGKPGPLEKLAAGPSAPASQPPGGAGSSAMLAAKPLPIPGQSPATSGTGLPTPQGGSGSLPKPGGGSTAKPPAPPSSLGSASPGKLPDKTGSSVFGLPASLSSSPPKTGGLPDPKSQSLPVPGTTPPSKSLTAPLPTPPPSPPKKPVEVKQPPQAQEPPPPLPKNEPIILAEDTTDNNVKPDTVNERIKSPPAKSEPNKPAHPSGATRSLPGVSGSATNSPGPVPVNVPVKRSLPGAADSSVAKPSAPRMGRVLWRFEPPRPPGTKGLPLRNCVAVDGEGRLFAALQNQLVAFVEQPGQAGLKTLWSYQTGAFIPGSPAIGPDGHVRIHAGDGLLHCVNTSKETVWPPVRVGEPLGWSSPLVDAANNTWISLYNGGLTKVEANGQFTDRPFFRSLSKFDSTGLIHQGVVYVGAEDQFVYAIDLAGRKGQNRWNQSENRGRTGWFINSSLALLGERGVVVASRDEHLHAFDWDGQPLWKTPLPGQALASPVVAFDRCFVGVTLSNQRGNESGLLVCVDTRSGRLIWEYNASGPVESTPVVGADRIAYFGDNSGTIHAVRTEDGKAEWTEMVNVPIRSAGTVISPGHLVFGLEDGGLIALECASKRLADGWPKYLGTLGQSGMKSQ